MRLATTPIDRVSDPSTSDSKVRKVSNVMLSPAPTGSNLMFPQSASSNTTMFAAPAMNEIRPPIPSNDAMTSRPHTSNTRHIMSLPSTVVSAMNEALHILPLEPSTVYSRSSTPNERPMMSPSDTSQYILEDKNNATLGQYLRFK